MFHLLFLQTTFLTQLGILIIRSGTGLLFVVHGSQKLIAGPAKWEWYGSQMGLLGIHFLPLCWGLCAALAETCGGLFLAVGFCTRLSAALLACVMIVALKYHHHARDPFMVYSHALSQLIIFIAFVVMGGGSIAIDTVLNK